MKASLRMMIAGAVMIALAFCSIAFAEDAKDTKDEDILPKVSATARDSLVVVQFRLQDPNYVLPPIYANLPEIERLRNFWIEDEPLVGLGVLVGNDTIYVDEQYFYPQMINSIDVVFFNGDKVTASVQGMLMDANAWVLKLDKPREKPGVTFKTDYRPKLGDSIPYAEMTYSFKKYTSLYYSSMDWLIEGNAPFYAYSNWGRGLAFDPDGNPVGFLFNSNATSDDGRTNWLAADFLKSPVLTMKEFADSMTKLGRNIGKEILPVRFEVRNKQAGTEDPVEFGIFVDGNGTLLVPCAFQAAFIKNIKRIMVTVGGSEKEAVFLGQLKHFSALFIHLPGFTKQSPLISLEGKPALMKAFLCLTPFSIARRADSIVHRGRTERYVLAYDDKIYGVTRNIPPGTFLFDKDGRCIGATMIQFRDWRNGTVYGSSSYDDYEDYGDYGDYSSRRQTTPSSLERPVMFSEILEIAAAPTAHLVPNIKPVSIEESKRFVWLGAELQGIDKNIAEMLGVLDDTKMGTIGGRIAFIYPGSPAEKAGLKVGDILLVISKKGTPGVIELAERYFSSYWWYRRFPWPDQRSRLINELMKYGEGSDVEIKFLRDKARQTTTLKLEAAPPDFVAAPNYKCYELGFRAKDLTFEVRNFFRLAPEFSGVILYAVESGSKAEVAQLGYLDIIVSINKQAVKNVKDCEAVVLNALEEQGETITFEILRLGETRFFEVKKPSKEEILKIREEHKFDTEDEENPENGGDGEAPPEGE
ncbi:MAG: PDZ domain-containing protein [Candidatus Brocadiia bacterium]